MPRPPKMQQVDYFPHMCSHNGKTMYILEQRFGNDGYTFWFKMLEKLGTECGHFIDATRPDQWEFMLARARVDDHRATDILNLLANLDAIDRELWYQDRVVWCQNFVNNLSDVYRKRRAEIPKKPGLRRGNTGKVQSAEVYGAEMGGDIGVSATETLQRIGQDRIGQDRIGGGVSDAETKTLVPQSSFPDPTPQSSSINTQSSVLSTKDPPLPEGFNPDHVTSDTPLPPILRNEFDTLTAIFQDPSGTVKGRNSAVRPFLKSCERWRILRNAKHYAQTDTYLRGFKMGLDKFVNGAYRDYDDPPEPLGSGVVKLDTAWKKEFDEDVKKAKQDTQNKNSREKPEWQKPQTT